MHRSTEFLMGVIAANGQETSLDTSNALALAVSVSVHATKALPTLPPIRYVRFSVDFITPATSIMFRTVSSSFISSIVRWQSFWWLIRDILLERQRVS